MIFLQDCQIINIILSNRIADEEQYVDLWFLLKTNIKSLIQENVTTQIYLEVCYCRVLIQLNSAKLLCRKLINYQINVSELDLEEIKALKYLLYCYNLNRVFSDFQVSKVRRSVVSVADKFIISSLGECYNPDLSCSLLQPSSKYTKFRSPRHHLERNQQKLLKLAEYVSGSLINPKVSDQKLRTKF
ncbi:Hypothetical_protein [Hexamita inflata]|uniref:Hypothetical_protein n=1 Tax=Hexamita inflata TaxID=28002 RepID=A0AA86PRX4_9EUKA|nr:Hypothetical protein HINF_LOCUS28045 [Hexamita inflata]